MNPASPSTAIPPQDISHPPVAIAGPVEHFGVLSDVLAGLGCVGVGHPVVAGTGVAEPGDLALHGAQFSEAVAAPARLLADGCDGRRRIVGQHVQNLHHRTRHGLVGEQVAIPVDPAVELSDAVPVVAGNAHLALVAALLPGQLEHHPLTVDGHAHHGVEQTFATLVAALAAPAQVLVDLLVPAGEQVTGGRSGGTRGPALRLCHQHVQPRELPAGVRAVLLGSVVDAQAEGAGDLARLDQLAEGLRRLAVSVGAGEADAFVFHLDGGHLGTCGGGNRSYGGLWRGEDGE